MFTDDFNRAANGIVECFELFGGDPVFGVEFRSNDVNLVFREKLGLDLEPRHVSEGSSHSRRARTIHDRPRDAIFRVCRGHRGRERKRRHHCRYAGFAPANRSR